VNYYFPITKKYPPNSLLKLDKYVSDKTIEKYLTDVFDKESPDLNKMVNNIELTCNFKGITKESLQDKMFMKL